MLIQLKPESSLPARPVNLLLQPYTISVKPLSSGIISISAMDVHHLWFLSVTDLLKCHSFEGYLLWSQVPQTLKTSQAFAVVLGESCESLMIAASLKVSHTLIQHREKKSWY